MKDKNKSKLRRARCWAHVRRIFWSALKDYNDEQAQEFIDLIGILYKVELENILLHRTEEEVLKARKLESIPVLNDLDQRAMALLARIKSKEVKVSSKLEHALNYMHNNWKALTAYIDVGSVLIDNNCCERAVRPFTNLRKSFGGFSSEKVVRWQLHGSRSLRHVCYRRRQHLISSTVSSRWLPRVEVIMNSLPKRY